jgi:hypothetical protein
MFMSLVVLVTRLQHSIFILQRVRYRKRLEHAPVVRYFSYIVIPSITDSQRKFLPLTDVFIPSLVRYIGNAYLALVVIDL